MDTEDFYTELFNYLESNDIRSINSISKLASGTSYHGIDLISSDDYQWIKAVFDRFKEESNNLLSSFLIKEIPLYYSSPYSVDGAFNRYIEWDVHDLIFQARANYSCVFPNSIVYLSEHFRSWDPVYWTSSSKAEYGIPIDFFVQLFSLKSSLEAGLAILIPSSIRHREIDGDFEFNVSKFSTYEERKKEGVIEFKANGKGQESLIETSKIILDSKVSTQLIKTPWIQGVKLDCFVNMVKRHPEEFNLYSRSFQHFISNLPQNENTLASWIEELTISSMKFDLFLKKRVKELEGQGQDIAIGAFCTVGSLLFPPPLNSILPAVFGTKSIADGYKWFREAKNLGYELNESEHWILWKTAKEKVGN